MALERFHWQVGKAAYYLGINRKTLRDKIRKYGLSEPSRPKSSGDCRRRNFSLRSPRLVHILPARGHAE